MSYEAFEHWSPKGPVVHIVKRARQIVAKARMAGLLDWDACDACDAARVLVAEARGARIEVEPGPEGRPLVQVVESAVIMLQRALDRRPPKERGSKGRDGKR